MRHYHILNLGAGVQSTTLHLLANEGKILDEAGAPVQFDASIFGDTKEEPTDDGENVYAHLEWLREQGGVPILTGTAGKLGDHLMRGTNSTNQRFASIPVFTLGENGKVGKTRRQCTSEYKIKVVELMIRRKILGLIPRQRVPKNVIVHQYMGISLDEAGRMMRAKARFEKKPIKWQKFHYPLIEQFSWTREECRTFLAGRVPHRVPRSACVFCPYHSNEEWQRIKARNGNDWKRVVEIDEILRIPGNVVNRKMNQPMFLHRSCKPINEIDFTADKNGDKEMAGECQGMCGN